MADAWIRVRGAREHNLRNVDVDLPRGRLTVLTGPSGSGKSSLAFDTLFAEGRRRYLETLRADTRALFAQLQRPDVDLVEGLPPTLSVSQHLGPPRPRSTLATMTEVHDHLRLLWARLGTPYCYQCGAPIRRHTLAEIVREVLAGEEGQKVLVLAPLVRNAKGDHKEVFGHIRQAGFLRARVDGLLTEVRDNPPLNPKKPHTIELVVDRLVLRRGMEDRLRESLEAAVKHGSGVLLLAQLVEGDWQDKQYSTRFACPHCNITYSELEPRHFNFNNPYGACPTCDGLGRVSEIDPALVVPDRAWTIKKVLERLQELVGGCEGLPAFDKKTAAAFAAAFPHPEGKRWTAATPLGRWPTEALEALLHGSERTAPPFPGLLPALRRCLAEGGSENGEETPQGLEALTSAMPCPACGGDRLNREARSVRFAGKTLPEVTALTVDEALAFFAGLAEKTAPLTEAHQRIQAVLQSEILHRLRFLAEVGLGYLTLDRPAPTLSGGETQRARLATHLGAGLLGVCYVLDEPTVGLHPRDTERLLGALRGLQERGNTVIVVEHDAEVIRWADYLIDMGPGAGKAGGQVVARGSVAEVLNNPHSVTAPYLGKARRLRQAHGSQSVGLHTPCITIRGARHHNLKHIDVSFPLGRLVCVSGVSGSGKSSLVRDTLCYAARRRLGLAAPPPGAFDCIEGLDQIDKVIEVDQTPLGRSSRSSAATCTGIWDEVRRIFANTREAKARGYTASRFSFNVRGGRCEECQGQGVLKVALHFLPDLTVPCPVCRGKRFGPATLAIRYRGKSVADVLEMSVEAAREFFANFPALRRPLEALADVGLGYLTLGQPAGALSGGEAQRVKLAAELARPGTGRTLYLLDEPTTGLHFKDVATLLGVLRRLVEAGNTVIVIEHNLDVIAQADWVIDLGPEGGEAGGRLVVAGTPADVAACADSVTGRWLSKHPVSLPV
jgi:excinuclease ABC subunit A